MAYPDLRVGPPRGRQRGAPRGGEALGPLHHQVVPQRVEPLGHGQVGGGLLDLGDVASYSAAALTHGNDVSVEMRLST